MIAMTESNPFLKSVEVDYFWIFLKEIFGLKNLSLYNRFNAECLSKTSQMLDI
jgi:hypothetical protein